MRACVAARSLHHSPFVVEAAIEAAAHPATLLAPAALLGLAHGAAIIFLGAVDLLLFLRRPATLRRLLIGRHEAGAATKAAGLASRRATKAAALTTRRTEIPAAAALAPRGKAAVRSTRASRTTTRQTAALPLIVRTRRAAALPLIVRLTDRDRPPIEEAPVERGGRFVETLIAHELDEAEAPTLSSLSIKHNACAPDLMASVLEMSPEGLICAAK